MTSRSERKAGKQTRQSLRLRAILAPLTTWLGLRHHVIQEIPQRLFGRWGNYKLVSLPRCLVAGDNLQPPEADCFYHTRIHLYLINMYTHGDDIVEIKLKESLEAFHLSLRLTRRGDKVSQDADNCVPRKEADLNVVSGHGGHLLSSEAACQRTLLESSS